jgi:uncharacterized protein (TIGR02588 family)
MTIPQKNWLEWTVFGLSLLLVAGVLGFLLVEGLRRSEPTPRVEVGLGAPVAQAGALVVPVTLYNLGDQSVEQVQVEIVLRRAGQAAERATLSVESLPRNSRVEGSVLFPGGGAALAVEHGAVGYVLP